MQVPFFRHEQGVENVRGFAILLGFNLAGLVAEKWLRVPLPGNVIGMILFTVGLYMKWIKLDWVEKTAQYLLDHLAMFFVPYVVGTMTIGPLLGGHWAPILLGVAGSTLVTLAVTGWITTYLSGDRMTSRRESLPVAKNRERHV